MVKRFQYSTTTVSMSLTGSSCPGWPLEARVFGRIAAMRPTTYLALAARRLHLVPRTVGSDEQIFGRE